MSLSQSDRNEQRLELTIVMPCLDEAETIASCIAKARTFIEQSGVRAEVLVADNGSADGSQDIARRAGARVVNVPVQGYGAALQGGIQAAQGRYVIMGDGDDSYDFSNLSEFLTELRRGAQLVMGNRFRGGIAQGAMPPLHRYLGNPVLSFIGRLFFKASIGDFHCGLRGFHRESILALDLQTTGMEFASEMVVRASLAQLRIAEVPTTLSKDGRSRPPHLKSWRDGWRHLRFLLIYSPKWMFLYPGVALLMAGLAGVIWLLPGTAFLGRIGFDIHTFMVACVAILVGVQCITLAVLARRFAQRAGLLPPNPRFAGFLQNLTLERMLLYSLAVGVCGITGLAWCFLRWLSVEFGPLENSPVGRIMMLSLTAVATSLQLAFTAFLAGVVDVSTQAFTRRAPNAASDQLRS